METRVPEEVFDEDYVYFYRARLTEDQTDREVSLIWQLLGLQTGYRVLDVPCGYGRIANRLGTRGCSVVGVDSSATFLELAAADAKMTNVSVDYRLGDMRKLTFHNRFDSVVNWFTSFGYFDEEENLAVLASMYRSLRPEGRLLLDTLSREAVVRRLVPGQEEFTQLTEVNSDLMVDRVSFDAVEGRYNTERFMVRDGRTRRIRFSIRLPTFTELRRWLMDVGYSSVAAYDEAGGALTSAARRLIVVAKK